MNARSKAVNLPEWANINTVYLDGQNFYLIPYSLYLNFR